MQAVDKTAAGFQIILPGCERRTLPKSTSYADYCGQGLLCFYLEPTQQERFSHLIEAPLTARRGQQAPPRTGLFRGL
jgi:hypothetical protein